ncbi:MAG: hypothetical protein CL879_02385 [Dehalococcoidia bacterium]|nr:hypothetical protein [Dehalococcoidia bacterium]
MSKVWVANWFLLGSQGQIHILQAGTGCAELPDSFSLHLLHKFLVALAVNRVGLVLVAIGRMSDFELVAVGGLKVRNSVQS